MEVLTYPTAEPFKAASRRHTQPGTGATQV